MSARTTEKSSCLTLEEKHSPAANGDDCDLWWEEGLSEDGTGGINQTAWGNRFARRWNDWLLRLVTASDSLLKVRAKMEELQFLNTSKMWSEWLGGRLTPVDFWTFCLFLAFFQKFSSLFAYVLQFLRVWADNVCSSSMLFVLFVFPLWCEACGWDTQDVICIAAVERPAETKWRK